MSREAPLDHHTKTRVLDAAERLFAEQGFEATSHRHITGAAGVNLSAVNYHFGSKEGLLRAVFERRLSPVNAERLERLARLRAERGEQPPSVEAVVRCLVEPPFRWMRAAGEEGERFMQLVGRTHSETSEHVHVCFLEQFAEVHRAFLEAFSHALPGLGRGELTVRFHFAIGAMAHTMAWLRKLRGEGLPAELQDTEALLESLVRFAAAGMTAPGDRA